MLSKKKKIWLIAVPAVLLVAVAVCLMALLIPRKGAEIADVWAASDQFDLSKIQTIEKTPGKDFEILMMTDIQLWTNLGDDDKTFRLMDELVEKTNPDLIVLPGDNVSGLTTDLYLRKFIKKMDSYQIPWAPTFGNHDEEGNATLTWQADRFAESKYCLFERGPSNLYGLGNYVINVTENGAPVETLFFFDNGRYTDYGAGGTLYDSKGEPYLDRDGNPRKYSGEHETYMGYEQIAWYEWNVLGIEKAVGRVVPSMTFSHCAQPEFTEAIFKHATIGEDGYYYVKEGDGEGEGFGYCKYLPASAPVNSGFIDKVKELGSTKYVFCGHDHENSASILYEGIRYTYGLKTGCSPRYWNGAREYGGTVVTLGDVGSVAIANKTLETI